MNQKTTLLVLGLALAITTALAIAPIVSEMAYAANHNTGTGHTNNANARSSGVSGISGSNGASGSSTGAGGAGGKGDNPAAVGKNVNNLSST
jgi:hypothetical protein